MGNIGGDLFFPVDVKLFVADFDGVSRHGNTPLDEVAREVPDEEVCPFIPEHGQKGKPGGKDALIAVGMEGVNRYIRVKGEAEDDDVPAFWVGDGDECFLGKRDFQPVDKLVNKHKVADEDGVLH